MRVLDVGCGPGAVSLMLSQRVGSQGHVFAVDHNPRMLDVARERTREAGVSNLTFVEGGLTQSFRNTARWTRRLVAAS